MTLSLSWVSAVVENVVPSMNVPVTARLPLSIVIDSTLCSLTWLRNSLHFSFCASLDGQNCVAAKAPMTTMTRTAMLHFGKPGGPARRPGGCGVGPFDPGPRPPVPRPGGGGGGGGGKLLMNLCYGVTARHNRSRMVCRCPLRHASSGVVGDEEHP